PSWWRRAWNGTVGEAPRLIEPTQQQAGATQAMVGTPALAVNSTSSVTFEKQLALLEPDQRLACLAGFRQNPGGGGHRVGERDDDVARPEGFDRALDRRGRFRPVALEQMERALGVVGQSDAVPMLLPHRLRQPGRPLSP